MNPSAGMAIIMIMTTTMTTITTRMAIITMTTRPALDDSGLYRLMSWLSPGFPVGAFSYSHGVEYAVEAGLVTDGDTLRCWLEGIIRHGTGRVDADLFRDAWRAVTENGDLAATVEMANAMRGTAEMARESAAQGTAFLDTLLATAEDPATLRAMQNLADTDRRPAYAVAVAVASASIRVPLQPALTAYLHALAANLISAAVRLVPLGQSDGQRTLARLEPAVIAATEASLSRHPDDFGAAAPMIDWCSMQHETQYTRLFRS